MVHQQGEVVGKYFSVSAFYRMPYLAIFISDSIESNIESAVGHVDHGASNIHQAADYSVRKYCYFFSLVLRFAFSFIEKLDFSYA